MTWAMNYWTGAAWTAIPAAATTGTYAGGGDVVYPPSTDYALNSMPCGAIGNPSIIIRSAWMTAGGFDWWTDLFVAPSVEGVTLDLEIYDRRVQGLHKMSGTLLRPQGQAHVGADNSHTTYTGVVITIINCTASSH